MKKYRRPKIKDGQIKLQKCKHEKVIDMCIFYADNIPACDRALIMYFICAENHNYRGGKCKSLIQELEDRNYDMDTFSFSICKKS